MIRLTATLNTMKNLRLVAVGLVILATVGFNLFHAPRWEKVWFQDAAFTPLDQVTRERAFRLWTEFVSIPVTLQLGFTAVRCVPPESDFFVATSSHSALTGLTLTTDCEPLDFTSQEATALHPSLRTTTLVGDFLYADNPNSPSAGGEAILVRARDDVLVLVGLDVLENLGLLAHEKKTP